jgi:VanZ family protein
MTSVDSPASVRRFLAIAAVASTIVLVYASLIPLNYTPLSWEETFERWRQIPWLQLGLYHRSDWVANALVVLPSGILAAAAVDWGRARRLPLLMAAPVISFVLACVVIGIELAQVWFPPRTVSLNDIVAGYIGAVIGPLIWVTFGPEIEHGIIRFMRLPRFEDRLTWMCVGYFVFAVVYSLMPLDLVMSRSEWQTRMAEGNVRLNPFSGEDASIHAVKGIVLGSLRMGPIGLLLALTGHRRLAAWILLLLPVALELLELPIYSKYVTSIEVLGGWLGGMVGYVLGMNLHRAERIFARPSLWGLAWIMMLVAILGALLGRHDQMLTDSSQIASRFSSAWSLPLAKYYSGTEYGALTNMLLKLGLFGIWGAVAFGWGKTSSISARRWIFWFTLLAAVIVAPAIELAQVALPPLVPDVSDALTYLAGYFAGYQLLRILWGTTQRPIPASHRGASFEPQRSATAG